MSWCLSVCLFVLNNFFFLSWRCYWTVNKLLLFRSIFELYIDVNTLYINLSSILLSFMIFNCPVCRIDYWFKSLNTKGFNSFLGLFTIPAKMYGGFVKREVCALTNDCIKHTLTNTHTHTNRCIHKKRESFIKIWLGNYIAIQENYSLLLGFLSSLKLFVERLNQQEFLKVPTVLT